MLYLEVVPAASTLEHIQPLVVSKPTPTTALTAPLLATEDPFVFIVPQATRALLVEYDELERALVSALQEQLAQAVAHGEGVLRDNDLPWALQAVEADTGEGSPRRPAFPTGEGSTKELRDSIGVHASAHHGAPPPSSSPQARGCQGSFAIQLGRRMPTAACPRCERRWLMSTDGL